MPELPDVIVYCESLTHHYGGKRIERVELKSPFVVRSLGPDLFEAEGRNVEGFSRLGKRIVWHLEGNLLLVVHLMIAGRFHRKKPGTKPRSKSDLVAFHFDDSTLMLTEASPKKRASIRVIADKAELSHHRPAGIDVLTCDLATFRTQLLSENHTLKRSLTSPSLFDGIGNAYSDEILHAACLSPLQWTSRMSEEQVARLFHAARDTLAVRIARLRDQNGSSFPEKVTAFRPEMAVHGKFGQPCVACDTKIARIRYADNETNYCPQCQTGGKLLADRSLSRLLKNDWPRSIDEE